MNTRTIDALIRLGLSYDDALAVRRISMTLGRWHEHECNGVIERDEETGKTYGVYNIDGPGPIRRYPVADRKRGAQRRLAAIVARYPQLLAYEQGDPRGCALYIIDRAVLGARDVHSCYSGAGVAVVP